MGGERKQNDAVEDRSPSPTCEIICPPDRHIPVEFNEIYSLVRTGLSVSERSRFEQIAQLVESLYAQEFMALKRNIKRNFLRFSAGAKDQPLISCVGGGLPTSAELDASESRLVADFLQLMALGRFHILSVAEWELAKADKFMFSLPVEVNWQYYDDKLLSAFWSSSEERRSLRAQLPDLADRVLVFHRGISTATASGRYTDQKIDLLVEYLVVEPLKKFWRWLRRRPSVAPTAPVSLNLTESHHAARKVVERRTLKMLMPTAWAVIKNFPKNFKLTEPAFKEVVVLYRAAAPAGRQGNSSRLPALQRPVEDRQRDILARRNIHVKAFHDIPMADMDVIFADKKVYLKPLTLIQMVVTVVGGLVAAFMVLMKGDKVDLNVLWSSLSLVAARCGQVYTSAQAERSKIIQDMVNILYDKTDDAQEGVLSMLLEDMAEQQLKEAILTYGLLYSGEAETTESRIDEDCERFLKTNFDLSVDFAVEDALPRLESWGLVRRNVGPAGGKAKYEAVHVETAALHLQDHWMRAFRALSEPPPTATFPLANLLSGQERAPPINAYQLASRTNGSTAAAGGGGTAGDDVAGAAGGMAESPPLPPPAGAATAPPAGGSPGATAMAMSGGAGVQGAGGGGGAKGGEKGKGCGGGGIFGSWASCKKKKS